MLYMLIIVKAIALQNIFIVRRYYFVGALYRFIIAITPCLQGLCSGDESRREAFLQEVFSQPRDGSY